MGPRIYTKARRNQDRRNYEATDMWRQHEHNKCPYAHQSQKKKKNKKKSVTLA
jgi:hypothetical protein